MPVPDMSYISTGHATHNRMSVAEMGSRVPEDRLGVEGGASAEGPVAEEEAEEGGGGGVEEGGDEEGGGGFLTPEEED
eukprot:2013125-Rhodomonas_salina.2